MAHGTFVTVINCMDGRTQLPVIKFLSERYNVDYVDSITEPGPVRILAERGPLMESIMSRVDISVNRHGSKVIAVVAHADCAGNPLPKKEQVAQMGEALRTLRAFDLGVELLPIWVGEDWIPEVIE